jgi:hypothetical protein
MIIMLHTCQLTKQLKNFLKFWTKTSYKMLHVLFFLLGDSLNFMCWRFRTLCVSVCLSVPSSQAVFCCLHHLWRWNRVCSKTLAYKIQTPGNHPQERMQHSEYCKSLKSRSYNRVIKNIHKADASKRRLDNCTGTQLNLSRAIENYLFLHA